MTPDTSSHARPTALVTGSSSGIGRELARLLAAGGHDLVLVARRGERLEALVSELHEAHGVGARALVEDLSDPGAPVRIFEATQAAGVEVDVLVNNAGFGGYGHFAQTDLERELAMIQVNATSLVHLTKLYVRGMVARGRGRIMNVASTAAFQAGPNQSIYYATKAFVLSFSEAIDRELRDTGVTVTAFCPGPTRTEFGERAGATRPRLLKAMARMSAEESARRGYAGMMAGRRLVVPGLLNKLGVLTVKFLPRRAATALAGTMQETPRE